MNSQKWIDVMKDEMKSIEDNDIWDLVEFPKGAKPICCKWIFKTNMIQKAISKTIKRIQLPKVSHKRKALIMKTH